MVELDGEGKLCVALELGSAVVDGGEEGDAECWSEEETAGGLLFIRSSCDSPMNDNPGPCITWFPTTGSRTAKSSKLWLSRGTPVPILPAPNCITSPRR